MAIGQRRLILSNKRWARSTRSSASDIFSSSRFSSNARLRCCRALFRSCFALSKSLHSSIIQKISLTVNAPSHIRLFDGNVKRDKREMKALLAIAAVGLFATPAFAWDTTNNTANVNNNHATSQADQQQWQTQLSTSNAVGKANATNTISISGAGGGNSGGNFRMAPDIALPSIGGGGNDCPTVGFGAGGSGLGGGGGFGPSWISSDCNKRKVTELLFRLGNQAAAIAYAEQNIDGVKEAFAAVQAVPVPVVMPVIQPVPVTDCTMPKWRDASGACHSPEPVVKKIKHPKAYCPPAPSGMMTDGVKE